MLLINDAQNSFTLTQNETDWNKVSVMLKLQTKFFEINSLHFFQTKSISEGYQGIKRDVDEKFSAKTHFVETLNREMQRFQVVT